VRGEGAQASTPLTALVGPRRPARKLRSTRFSVGLAPDPAELTRHQVADRLNAAEQTGGSVYAMACLLLLNGLRVSEVCSIDIDDLAEERGHHTVTIPGKGDEDATVPLAPRTRAAVEQAIDDRDSGPLLCNRWGNRRTRHNPAAPVASIATRAGIQRRMTPHLLRHRPAQSRIRVAITGVAARSWAPAQGSAMRTRPSVGIRLDVVIGCAPAQGSTRKRRGGARWAPAETVGGPGRNRRFRQSWESPSPQLASELAAS
jgi:hypothetical protein